MSSADRLPGPLSRPPVREPAGARYCPKDNRPLRRIGDRLFRCKACGRTWSEEDLRSEDF